MLSPMSFDPTFFLIFSSVKFQLKFYFFIVLYLLSPHLCYSTLCFLSHFCHRASLNISLPLLLYLHHTPASLLSQVFCFPLLPSPVSPCTLASSRGLLWTCFINLSLPLRSSRAATVVVMYCNGSNTTFSCLTSLMYSFSQGGNSCWLIVAAQMFSHREWESQPLSS